MQEDDEQVARVAEAIRRADIVFWKKPELRYQELARAALAVLY